MTSLSGLSFDNRFTRELPGDPETSNSRRQVRDAAFSRVLPTPVAKPTLAAYSAEVAELIGLTDVHAEELAKVLGGNEVLPDMDPFAMCYGGHQFGNWAGQLGDGRAINLGEVINDQGEHWTLQLKGAGPTPYSRTADGLAVMRSSVREFLCSEAMYHLGVPTTRALSLVATGEQVQRDMFYDGNPKWEPGAVVCRVSPSFVRFGNFELPASRRDKALLRNMVEFTIENDFPQYAAAADNSATGSTALDLSPELAGDWFAEVCRRTAVMIIHWMRVGFVHGVMNTDNMSILGLTIDYGPYGWLEDFNPGWTPNTTDAQGRRYRFGQQPEIAGWNLNRLANALAFLFDDTPSEAWLTQLERGLSAYSSELNSGWNRMMADKLGLDEFRAETDELLVGNLMKALQATEIDMTIFFRRLSRIEPSEDASTAASVRQQFADALYDEQSNDESIAPLQSWLDDYRHRLRGDGISQQTRMERMNSTNPKYVLRNYLAQLAIDKAEVGDYSLVNELLDLLRRPYDEQPEHEQYAVKRPEWARHRAGCSMLSCSS